jgi:N utilization substance protein A
MVDVKTSIIPALEQIERVHKLSKEEIIAAIEDAINTAARKYLGPTYRVVTEINLETADPRTYIVKKVVAAVSDPDTEISVGDARTVNPGATLGGEVRILINNDEFTRIAAQAAKRIITQRIRESDKKNVYADFESRIGQVVNGVVYNISGKAVIVDLGKAEGLMPQREQVFKEKFKIGDHLKVLIKGVEHGRKGVTVIVSRFDKDFIAKLFEAEIPEVKDGVVQIRSIVRAPGYRTKLMVSSNNPRVDPVGACVGMKGMRIRPIIEELQGERIDLIPYTEDPIRLVTYALSPVKPESVTIVDTAEKTARVTVTKRVYDTIMSKNNINLNLAKELTGWNMLLEAIPEPGARSAGVSRESVPDARYEGESGPAADAGGGAPKDAE